MTKFESAVKVMPASQKAVYEKLSDLSNLEKVKDRLPQDKVKNLSFDAERKSLASASSLQQPPRLCPLTCGYR